MSAPKEQLMFEDSQLTSKQEKFAQCVASGMSQAEAYRQSFNVGATTKDKTVQEAASRLMADSKVSARVEHIRKPIVQKAQITLESHLEELKVLRELAKDSSQLSAAIAAEVSRGKASGLYTDKVEHSGSISNQSEEQIKARIAELEAKRAKKTKEPK